MHHLADRLRWRPPVEALGAPIPVRDDAVQGADEHGVVRQAQEIRLLPQRGGIALVLGVETGILQRDRGLRGQQRQHRTPGRREDVRRQGVFEIEHAGEPGLVEQRYAEDGPGVLRAHVRIGGKRVRGRGIVEQHAVPRADDILDDGLGQRRRGHGLVCQTHDDGVAAGRGFRRDAQLVAARQDQQPPLSTGVLNRRTHERVEQFLEDDLAGHGLRDFEHGREVQVFDRCPDRARRSRAPASSVLRCG